MGMELALNLVLAALLVAFIFYAWRLHKRLGTWREGKAELDRTIKEFNEAARRAEAAIADLKIAGEAAGRLLEDQTRKAVALKDDLEYIVARATPIADRAAEGARYAAASAAPARAPRAEAAAPTGEEERLLRDAIKFAEREGTERQTQRSQAEQELLKAIAERRRGAAVALAGAAALGTAMGVARAGGRA
ncbi:MAG: hypothetical protein ING19_14460 [Azospirillum sp.]|nr:hypothetical protein [Azospirillum sp.]